MSQHPHAPAASFDGGDLDCGSGLLLLIRQHIDPLAPGQLLEIRSTEISVVEDLPAWCRMTGNELVSHLREGRQSSFLVSKGRFVARGPGAGGAPAVPSPSVAAPASASPSEGAASVSAGGRQQAPITQPIVPVIIPASLPAPAPAPAIAPLSVMGIGSWPRPRWLRDALHARLEGRLDEAAFAETADDAVRLAVGAQQEAGVDVLTDGEQRRDSYASFVGARLDNCQLIPITDLLPYVDDPDKFQEELRALDVPAAEVRHPAVFGRLGRSRPLAVDEAVFVQRLAPGRPVKVALPGPYLLTRTMWMECISDRAYATREELAVDVVRVLREELHHLLAAGVALVQLDEPVLTEVVFGQPSAQRTFMCGALGARRDPDEELALAERLWAELCAGLPRDRLALHVCRGNWTPDERVALAGDYRPLVPVLSRAPVGTLFLELATPRAGDQAVLEALPADKRLGLGMVNQKRPEVEPLAEVLARAEHAVARFGAHRLLLNPDCGFATFADNPVASAAIARGKLAVLVEAARVLRARHL